jgi:hypothetical protein
MPEKPKPVSTPPPNTAATLYVKTGSPSQTRVEDVDRLIGDPRKGVGVAATDHPPKSGIFGKS